MHGLGDSLGSVGSEKAGPGTPTGVLGTDPHTAQDFNRHTPTLYVHGTYGDAHVDAHSGVLFYFFTWIEPNRNCLLFLVVGLYMHGE